MYVRTRSLKSSLSMNRSCSDSRVIPDAVAMISAERSRVGLFALASSLDLSDGEDEVVSGANFSEPKVGLEDIVR